MPPSWSDDDWVMISALEHYVYCPRQCALIHLEFTFDENIYTLRGRREHQRVDEDTSSTSADGIVTHFALPLQCERLGVYGKADAVEFWPDGTVYPVEHKHGKRRSGGKLHDAVQLAAQAMCLEEMLGKPVLQGAVFYQQTQRRQVIEITDDLRQATERVIEDVRQMLKLQQTPPPLNNARCPNCSLIEACQPELVAELRQAPPALFKPVPSLGVE